MLVEVKGGRIDDGASDPNPSTGRQPTTQATARAIPGALLLAAVFFLLTPSARSLSLW